MGQGTSAPPTDPNAGASNVAPGSSAKGLTDNQMKAIAMLMGNLGKSGTAVTGMTSQQGPDMYPQTSTIQGGTYFNPNQQR